MLLEEKDLKNRIKRNDVHPRCLLYGDDSFLILSYRRKLMELYERNGCAVEVYESRSMDFESFLERSSMVSLMGDRRAIFIDDFESSLVPPENWDSFLEFCGDTETGDLLVITAGNNFDPKGKAKDKIILGRFSKDLFAVDILKHRGTVLRDELRTLCKREGCDLSGDLASYMIEVCGEDLELLKNECAKLCAYIGKGGTVTKNEIDKVCSKKAEANLYELASLLLKGDIREALLQIDTLLSQKTAVMQIAVSLSMSFYGLYCASCAREEGKTSDIAARELNERFAWRMRNYFRDSLKFKRQNLFKAFDIMCRAENDLKSKSQDERTVLELACVRASEAVRERL